VAAFGRVGGQGEGDGVYARALHRWAKHANCCGGPAGDEHLRSAGRRAREPRPCRHGDGFIRLRAIFGIGHPVGWRFPQAPSLFGYGKRSEARFGNGHWPFQAGLTFLITCSMRRRAEHSRQAAVISFRSRRAQRSPPRCHRGGDDELVERRGAERQPRMRISDPGATAPEGNCDGMRLAKLLIPPGRWRAELRHPALSPESRCRRRDCDRRDLIGHPLQFAAEREGVGQNDQGMEDGLEALTFVLHGSPQATRLGFARSICWRCYRGRRATPG